MTTPAIEEQLRRLEQKIDEVLKTVRGLPGAPVEYIAKTADDGDLDGKYGNPEIRFELKEWPGYKGRKFSECDSPFLTEYARFLDNLAKKQAKDPEKAKYSQWSAKDAARARGWAFRNEGKPAATVQTMDFENAGSSEDDGFPF